MLRMQERTFPGFKFQKFSGRVLPQTSPLPFMRGILVTHVAFSHCYPPSNILSHRKVPFKKMPPPHGKILKKGPGTRDDLMRLGLFYIKIYHQEFVLHVPIKFDDFRNFTIILHVV